MKQKVLFPDSEENTVEQSDETDVPIKVPFDPNLIRIRRDPFTLGQLIDKIEFDEIDFFTGFQRKSDLWNEKQQSSLIESILLRLPLPAFYFDEGESNRWQVIDGLQRTSAVRNFVLNKKNPLKLQKLEFLDQFEGDGYDDLPGTLQRRIKTTPLTVYLVEKGTPDEVKFNIFKRINTGGLILTPQEIRHALNQGIPAKFVEELAAINEFKSATCNIIKKDRMEDRDFVTRFVSFYITPYSEYLPDLDNFMTRGMKAIRTLSEKGRQNMKEDFTKAMQTAISIFGADAFRKRQHREDGRRPINKALFESISVVFSKLSDKQREKLVARKEILKDKFIQLNQDKKFFNSLASGTGQKESVNIRFTEIIKIVNETISNQDDTENND
jgi:hypothetical protein